MLSLTSSHLLQRLEHLLSPPFPLLFHPLLSLHHLIYVAVVPLFKSPALSLSLSLSLVLTEDSSQRSEQRQVRGKALYS
jgi:hypothetical protein